MAPCFRSVSYTHLRAHESRGLGDVYKRQSHKDVKITPVVSDIEDSLVFRNPFLTDISDFHAGQPQAPAERPIDNGQGAAVFDIHIKFADNPFRNEKRYAQDKKNNYKKSDTDKTNHRIIPSFSGCVKAAEAKAVLPF